MRYVLDTHALIWFLMKDNRLSERVKTTIQDPQANLVIPAIVLAESKYIADRKRVTIPYAQILDAVTLSPNYTIAPLDTPTISLLPDNLDIHDGLIVATALRVQDLYSDEVAILTNDLRITISALANVIW